MVCGSGHAYNTASAGVHRSEQSASGDGQIVTADDLDADVMMLLEDVTVRLGDRCCSARVFWDDGSNRILITSSFAKKHKLRSQPVSFKLDGICGSDKVEKGEVKRNRKGVDSMKQRRFKKLLGIREWYRVERETPDAWEVTFIWV